MRVIGQSFHRHRPARGQALIESAVGLMVISMMLIIAVVFIADVGLAVYYKQKLSFAACQSAQNAMDACTWDNALRPGVSDEMVRNYTEKQAAHVLAMLGLPPADFIEIQRTNEDIKVKLRMSNLRLIQSGFFPSFISLEETGGALFSTNQPPGLLTIRTGDPSAMEGQNQSVVIPVYGRFSLSQSAPDMRAATGTRANDDGEAVLLGSKFPQRMFDIHIHQGLADFFDRSSAQAQAERNAYIRQNGAH